MKLRAVRGSGCNVFGATRPDAHRVHWKLIDDAAAAHSLPHLCAAFDRFVAGIVTAVTSARTALVLWACCFSAQALCVQADSWDWQSTKCEPFCARQVATVTYLPHLHLYIYTSVDASTLQQNAMLPACRAMRGGLLWFCLHAANGQHSMPPLPVPSPTTSAGHRRLAEIDTPEAQSVCEFFQSGRSDPTNCCSWGK